MILGIDHVVLATPELDAAAAALEATLGLTATGGGRHAALGTENRLIWLGDAYLELIGVFDDDLAGRSWLGRPVLDALDRGGGLVTWAIAVDDLDEALRWGPPDGDLSAPQLGERVRPDGGVVRWRLARPEPIGPTAPFLIEHDRDAAEWTSADRAARSEERHPVGGRVRLVGLDVPARSPAAAAGRLRRQLAVTVEPGGWSAVRVRFGDQVVRFVADPSPGPATHAAAAGAADRVTSAGAARAHPAVAGVVDLMADVAMRTRVTSIGGFGIRLRGMTAEARAEGPTEGPAEPSSGAAAGSEPGTNPRP